MKVIRVFPRCTSFTPRDDYAFVGDPPLPEFRPRLNAVKEVRISVTFTWDIEKAQELACSWGQYYPVKIGGPALISSCDGFEPGVYIKQGVTFTSRGCNNQCPWCLVPNREGKLRELPIVAGNTIQDNNLLQCSQIHISKVFDMLKTQRAIEFSGGLDARLLTDKIADELRSLRIKQVFLACDTREAIKPLRKATQRLKMSRDKVRCYALLKFDPNETISVATERMVEIWEAGAMPFAQLFQPPDQWIDYPREWKRFARTWCRPAAMKSVMELTNYHG